MQQLAGGAYYQFIPDLHPLAALLRQVQIWTPSHHVGVTDERYHPAKIEGDRMYHDDLTMSEVLHDPIIRLMLRADQVTLGEFAKIMENAARARNFALAGMARVVLPTFVGNVHKGSQPVTAPIEVLDQSQSPSVYVRSWDTDRLDFAGVPFPT